MFAANYCIAIDANLGLKIDAQFTLGNAAREGELLNKDGRRYK
jgi:hypothetical protein